MALQSSGGTQALNSSRPLLSLFCYHVGSGLLMILSFLRVGSDQYVKAPTWESENRIRAFYNPSFNVRV